MAPGGHQHRSGSLKQKNKAHNASHASKRSLKRAQGGKVNAQPARRGSHARLDEAMKGAKDRRMNMRKEARKQHKAKLFLEKRTGTNSGAPLSVCVVPMSAMVDSMAVATELAAHSDRSSVSTYGGGHTVTVMYEALKRRVQFAACPATADALAAVELAGCCDVVLLVFSGAGGAAGAVDEGGMQRAAALRAHGMGAVLGTACACEGLNAKAYAEFRKGAAKFVQDEFTDASKFIASPTYATMAVKQPDQARVQHAQQVLRAITGVNPSGNASWRANRSFVTAHHVDYNPADGTLLVCGYVRGVPLCVNQLVHVPGVGARALRQITAHTDPCPVKVARGGAVSTPEGAADGTVLATSSESKVDPLRMDAEPDGMMGEQTWPTNEELRVDDGALDKDRLPPGVSDYQAAWLGPEDLEDGEDGEDEEGDVGMVDLGSYAGTELMRSLQAKASGRELFAFVHEANAKHAKGSGGASGAGGADDGTLDLDAGGFDDDDDEDGTGSMMMMDGDEGDARLTAADLQRRRRERADEDYEFPDEVDTPFDMPARQRFARYRNLKSFRTSPWDPKESLPRDYARLFDFGDFRVVQKRALYGMEKAKTVERQQALGLGTAGVPPLGMGMGGGAEGDVTMGGGGVDGDEEDDDDAFDASEWVHSGSYVGLHVSGVGPAEAERVLAATATGPLTLHALHRHENRLSTLNFAVQRSGPLFCPADSIVKSKDVLWFHCGFRRWQARPIFSEQNLNGEKHKFYRYLPPGGGFTVASCYGPATYGNAPVLVFRERGAGPMQLVATGSLASVDVDRIVLKKVMLTGYPVRVHKRTAVIKHMFYDPTDIAWFRPAELTTKLGLTGHIKCPIGTHGLFKVHFGRVVQGNDTVCLNLFKRVYPKFVGAGGDGDDGDGEAADEGDLLLEVL